MKGRGETWRENLGWQNEMNWIEQGEKMENLAEMEQLSGLKLEKTGTGRFVSWKMARQGRVRSGC